MAKVKVLTTKKHRWGREINVSGVDVVVDSKGFAEVEEKYIPYLLVAGFELENKDQKFDSLDKLKDAEKVEEVLGDARAEAQRIIEEAKLQAEKIIGEANRRAGKIVEESQVDVKEQYRKDLEKLTVEKLQEHLATVKVAQEKYKGKKKSELIDFILELTFKE